MDKFVSFTKRKDVTPENETKVKKAKGENLELMESPNDISQRTGDKLARPLLKAYPKHMDGKSHGRSFVASWYERYSWMEYSQDFDAVFCFPCRHFCPLVTVTLKRHLRRLDFVAGRKHMEKMVQ